MRRARWLWVVLMIAAACDAPSPAQDGAPVGVDGSAPDSGSDGGEACTIAGCDDGLYCNGTEACASGACMPGTPPCSSAMCDEDEDECPCGPGMADFDGDGHDSVGCGGGDCDDDDPNRFPGNAEYCDPEGHDEDCDPSTFGFRDSDGDDEADGACCNTDAGGVAHCGTDCDDTRAGVNPSAPEVCNLRDDDCDSSTDEDVLVTYFPDLDGDGFGDPSGAPTEACSPPDHYAAMATDCNDLNGGVHPSAMEICDSGVVDENCDGVANPETQCDCTFGEARDCMLPGVCAAGREMCNAEGSWDTCSIAPGSRIELCNGDDDDCDNQTDEGLLVNCYADTDNDTYPDSSTTPVQAVCPDPSRILVGTCPNGMTNRVPGVSTADCAPMDSTRNPSSTEVCNMLDDNCVGGVDEGVSNTCYVDADGDHYALPGATGSRQCNDPTRAAYGYCPVGYTNTAPSSTDFDCNGEALTAQNSHALELCDPAMVDEDCDGVANPTTLCNCTVTGTPVSCGTALGVLGACASGTTTCVGGMWSACSIAPSAETCNGVDDDCNGTTDNGVLIDCYSDTDNDTYPDNATTPLQRVCPVSGRPSVGGCPSGTTNRAPSAATADSCAPNDASRNPGVAELCDAIDQNCNGTADEGFGCVRGSTISSSCTTACGAPGGTQLCSSSCTPLACLRATEACNFCDDVGDGGTDQSVATATQTSTGATCAQLTFTGSAVGQCSDGSYARVCPGSVPGGEFGSVRLTNGVRVGWGTVRFIARVQLADVVFDGLNPSDSVVFNVGSRTGPLGLWRGIALEWVFTPSSETDSTALYLTTSTGTSVTATALSPSGTFPTFDHDQLIHVTEVEILYTPPSAGVHNIQLAFRGTSPGTRTWTRTYSVSGTTPLFPPGNTITGSMSGAGYDGTFMGLLLSSGWGLQLTATNTCSP